MPLGIPPPSTGLASGSSVSIGQGSGTAVPAGIEAVLEYNGIYLNNRSWIDTYLVTSIDGLGDADIRDDRDVNPQAHGETYFKAFYGGRTVVLSGKIRAFTLSKLRDMTQGLRQAFANLDHEKPLYFHAGNPDYTAVLYCKKAAPLSLNESQNTPNHFERDFQVTLRASNPRFLSKTAKQISVQLGRVDTFAAADSLDYFTFDAGAGAASVSGGVLTVSSTGIKRAYRNDLGLDFADQEVAFKYTPDATFTSSVTGAIIKRIDSSNYLLARISATGAPIITSVDAGVSTTLATGGTSVSRTGGTPYWVRCRISGDVVTIDHFTADPRQAVGTPSPTVSYSYTLTGSAATKYGAGVRGGIGFSITPGSTAWTYDDMSFGPLSLTSIPVTTITNIGNFEAQPVLTLNGPMTNPIITNALTDETIQFDGTIADDSTWTIDTENRTIIDQSGANQFSKLNVASDWLGLESGDNSIVMTASGLNPVFSGNAWRVPTLTISHRDAWI